MVIAYKLKGISIEKDQYGSNYLRVKLVARFKDGKYDKFIPMREAIQFLDKAVIYEDDFNSVMSKADKKKNQIGLF